MTSKILVGLQFLYIALILWPFGEEPWQPFPAVVLIVIGMAVGFWALRTNRLGNFNIRPEPKPGAQFITSGAYAYVRHPMYLAVMLVTLGFCMLYNAPPKWLLLVLLALVLWLKAGMEEQFMFAAHEDYAEYRRRTKAIIPFIL
jgi:protein-S-isoprenylcysteine O-methyltransferase Ste14